MVSALAGKVPGLTLGAVNTDAVGLSRVPLGRKLIFGESVVQGKGCGANPETGAEAARSDAAALLEFVAGFDTLVIVDGKKAVPWRA